MQDLGHHANNLNTNIESKYLACNFVKSNSIFKNSLELTINESSYKCVTLTLPKHKCVLYSITGISRFSAKLEKHTASDNDSICRWRFVEPHSPFPFDLKIKNIRDLIQYSPEKVIIKPGQMCDQC